MKGTHVSGIPPRQGDQSGEKETGGTVDGQVETQIYQRPRSPSANVATLGEHLAKRLSCSFLNDFFAHITCQLRLNPINSPFIHFLPLHTICKVHCVLFVFPICTSLLFLNAACFKVVFVLLAHVLHIESIDSPQHLKTKSTFSSFCMPKQICICLQKKAWSEVFTSTRHFSSYRASLHR